MNTWQLIQVAYAVFFFGGFLALVLILLGGSLLGILADSRQKSNERGLISKLEAKPVEHVSTK